MKSSMCFESPGKAEEQHRAYCEADEPQPTPDVSDQEIGRGIGFLAALHEVRFYYIAVACSKPDEALIG